MVDLDALFDEVESGNRRSAGVLMSLVEDGASFAGSESCSALRRLYASRSRALVIGVTGWPGVGKSSLINRLGRAFLDDGKKVGIIAIDPTSPFSGGSLLGDRIRFRDIEGEKNVFIRSMASRGHHGGISRSARALVKTMEAMGIDIVVVETVGIGQDQVEVSLVADTTIVVVAPGLGDYLQAFKSGILEIGDIFVVNKADRDDADKAVSDLESALGLKESGGWRPPVIKTIAADGSGVGEVMIELMRHGAFREKKTETPATKLRAAADEIREAIKNRLLEDFLERQGSRMQVTERQAEAICRRQADPSLIAEEIVGSRGGNKPNRY
jgi:LAO/AO transport system kinase